ncbi:MAG: transposase [Aestuariivita sp.]|nr:transposase [Aestuariivita sp.]
MTSKIVALTDAVKKLICFVVLSGQSHDLMAVSDLLQDLSCERLISDKAFNLDALFDMFVKHGAEAVIPPKTIRNVPRNFDRDVYRDRHRIENVFATIKEFCAIETRYHKTASSFAAGIHLVSRVIAALEIPPSPNIVHSFRISVRSSILALPCHATCGCTSCTKEGLTLNVRRAKLVISP